MTLTQITRKYLKGQKKHTIMSILAITVSVAFMTVLLCALSVYRATSLNISRNSGGSYHVVFNSLSKEESVTIRNMDIFGETEIYGISKFISSVDLDMKQMQEQDARQMYLVRDGNLVNDVFLRMNAEEMTLLPDSMRECTEGRMPEKDGEIVIANSSAYMWDNPQVGDTVTALIVGCKYKEGNSITSEQVPPILSETFDIDEVKEISFTVVGFTEENNVVCYNDTNLKTYSSQFDHLIARFSDNANNLYWNMSNAFDEKGYEIDRFDYAMNQELLNAENKGTTARFQTALFFAVMYLFLIFIMFCARLVIDDSFEISSKERIKQFGLLKAVGASRKQIFAMLCNEAFILALPGVIMGIVLGVGLASLIFAAVKYIAMSAVTESGAVLGEMFSFELKPYIFFTAVILGFLWVFVSAVATGMRSIRSTPVEALHAARHTETVKTPKHASGIERGKSFISAYSSVSIKRNTKRYVITIISMVLSIVLFTSFSYAAEMLKNKIDYDYGTDDLPYDYSVTITSFYPYEALARQNDMINSGLFKDVQLMSSLSLYNETSEDMGMDGNITSEYGLVVLRPVTRETFDSMIKPLDSSITYDQLVESGAAVLSRDMYSSEDGKLTGFAYNNAPKSITGLTFAANVTMFSEDVVEVPVAGLYNTDCSLFRGYDGRVSAVMAEPAYYSLFDYNNQIDNTLYAEAVSASSTDISYYYQRVIYAKSSGDVKAEQLFLKRNFYGSFVDITSEKQHANAMLTMVKVMGYFVVFIIAIIAIINIVNIISANVLNRNAELAMLRACGMSDTQIFKLLLTESLKYALISGVIATILTELIIFIMRLPFTSNFHDLYFEDIGVEFTYLPTVKYLVTAVAAAFAVAAAASLLPARRTVNSSIVENIRAMEG